MSRQQVVTAELANGAVTTAKILDATIATADLANSSVTNVKLASDTARASLLVNGSFDIWQRGAGPFPGNTYSADRWVCYLGTSSTVSITKVANGPGGGGTSNSLQVVNTHVASSLVAQELKISEGMSALRGKALTFSAWVYSTAASAAGLAISTDGTGGVEVLSAVVAGSTWTRLSCTYPAVPNDATFVRVYLRLTASCTALLNQAMLVVGSVAADYAPLHPADDLARCQRYYEVTGNQTWPTTAFAASAGGQTLVTFLTWVPKPATPTVTTVVGWSGTNASAVTTDFVTSRGCRFWSNSAAAGYASIGLNVGASITLESNP